MQTKAVHLVLHKGQIMEKWDNAFQSIVQDHFRKLLFQ